MLPSPARTPGETTAGDLRAAAVAFGAFLAVAAVGIPYGGRQIGDFAGVLPALGAGALVAMAVSAAILWAQYRVSHRLPSAVLATAFAVAAALELPYLLVFPSAFSSDGFGVGPRAAGWLWALWHLAFVLAAGVYVWSEAYAQRNDLDPARGARIVRRWVKVSGFAAAAGVAAVVLGSWHLPVVTAQRGYAPAFHLFAQQGLLAGGAAVLAALIAVTGLRTKANLWLGVVLLGMLCELYVGGELSRARFSVAWYLAAVEAFGWQALFLLYQVHTTNAQLQAYADDQRSLVDQTLRDPLTNLFNRRGFDVRLDDALRECRLTSSPIALLALDIDFFKQYNDHFGHVAGDVAIRLIGDALRTVANRPTDSCCRIGGEEFAVVLPFTDATGAMTVAERLRAAVMRLSIPHAPAAPLKAVTISIGVCTVDASAETVAGRLYDRADRALYRAKRQGRNRIAVDAVATPGQLRAL